MYLIHNTTLEYLKLILEDQKLKSSKLTGNLNEGDGIYKSNNYVYFQTTDTLFDKNVIGWITLYLNSDLLYNRNFFISTVQSAAPYDLGEWIVEYKKGEITKEYKRKYNRYSNNYNKILLDLYNHNVLYYTNRKFFQFHQIAILNKVNIKKSLIGINFIKIKPPESIIKYIQKYYPNVKINMN